MPRFYAAGVGVFAESAGTRHVGKQPANTGSVHHAPPNVRVRPDVSVGPFTEGNAHHDHVTHVRPADPRPSWNGERPYRPITHATTVRKPRDARKRPLGPTEQRRPSGELTRGIRRKEGPSGLGFHHGRTA